MPMLSMRAAKREAKRVARKYGILRVEGKVIIVKEHPNFLCRREYDFTVLSIGHPQFKEVLESSRLGHSKWLKAREQRKIEYNAELKPTCKAEKASATV